MTSPDDTLGPVGSGSEFCAAVAAFPDLNVSGLFWAWLGYVSCFLTLETLTPHWNKNSPGEHIVQRNNREEKTNSFSSGSTFMLRDHT